ncbi:hypothetical protein CBR_g18997 [Chara braunii]|uniref:RRM domain-containing protein n=1 Tax=Chara braunii TaxID=69332 RepID=A0A388KX48_CHABU|nr:hypothetical protein CBR_g18997 [Chara braunii]|eukprot:GBG74588.1 hypothetical protein CBR_g18997 [Chara braunii]
MSGSGSQPQFRYTQPPSKVIHIRNLPWECTEEELLELCKPFGRVVNTKLNVGANHNQAFVEMADLNQAIAMVSYFASSSEPAQVRGKAVYLQYSTRQEIVTSKNSGDVASNVLLVTIEGVEDGQVSIDVLHLVFSAFGFVHKIATFEKSAGFQEPQMGVDQHGLAVRTSERQRRKKALVQFGDAATAASAKAALEGRSIPRYLLPDNAGPCSLRISFSAHNDLNVKFQSHRSRDYTNPYLPVAASATDGGAQREPESNVLLVSIENMQYAVTIDVLHTVFSAFGPVQKIAIFEKSAGFQALVQYPDIPTAVQAKESLEGHCIYDGGFCKLRLSFSRHTDLNVKVNNERSRDYTNPNLPSTPTGPGQRTMPTTPVSIDSPLIDSTPVYTPSYQPSQYTSPMPLTVDGVAQPVTGWDYEQAHAIAAKGQGPPGPPPPGPLHSYGSAGMPPPPPLHLQGGLTGGPPPQHLGPNLGPGLMAPPGPPGHLGPPPPPPHGMPLYGPPMPQGPGMGMPTNGTPNYGYM